MGEGTGFTYRYLGWKGVQKKTAIFPPPLLFLSSTSSVGDTNSSLGKPSDKWVTMSTICEGSGEGLQNWASGGLQGDLGPWAGLGDAQKRWAGAGRAGRAPRANLFSVGQHWWLAKISLKMWKGRLCPFIAIQYTARYAHTHTTHTQYTYTQSQTHILTLLYMNRLFPCKRLISLANRFIIVFPS